MFVFTIYLTRSLGTNGFGVVIFSFSFLAFGAMLVDFGFDQLGQREVTRGRIPLRDLVETVVSVRLILSVVAFGILAVVVLLNDINARAKPIILIYALSLLTNAVDLNWVFFGKEKTRYPAIAEILVQAIYVVPVLVFVRSVDQLIYVPLAFLAGRTIAVTFQIVCYLRHFGIFVPRLRWKVFQHLVPEAMPLWGSMIIVQMMNNFAPIALGVFVTMTEAGIFGAAQRVIRVPTFLILAYYTTIRPSINRAHREGFASVEFLLRKSMRLSMGLAVGLAVGGWMTAAPLITALFKEDYLGGVLALRLLLLSTALFIVNRHYRFLLIAFSHQAVDLKLMMAAAVVNVGTTIALIKPWGAAGAAAGILGGEILITAVAYLLALSLVGYVPMARFLPKPLVCAAVMAGVLTLCAPLHVAAQIAIGGSVYCIALLALGVVRVQEVKIAIGGFLPNRPAQGQGT